MQDCQVSCPALTYTSKLPELVWMTVTGQDTAVTVNVTSSKHGGRNTRYRCFFVAANMAASTVLSHSSGRPSVTMGATKGRYSPSGENTPVVS